MQVYLMTINGELIGMSMNNMNINETYNFEIRN